MDGIQTEKGKRKKEKEGKSAKGRGLRVEGVG